MGNWRIVQGRRIRAAVHFQHQSQDKGVPSYMAMNTRLILATALALALPFATFAADYSTYNTRVGTQTFDPDYQFEGGTKNKLMETADRIQEMGSDIVKFEMSSRVNSTYGVNLSGVSNLSQMANQADYQNLWGRDFDTYAVWMFPMSVGSLGNHWIDGYSSSESNAEYNEIYNFIVALRNEPKLAGKTVLVGNWEGDNALRNFNMDPGYNPGSTAINAMKSWFSTRQAAVDAAKAATSGSSVNVYHYAEVNLVLQTQWAFYWNVTDHVLADPNVAVDLVSYSAWDTSTVIPFNNSYMDWSLNKLQNTPNYTSAFPGSKKVFLGEYGQPLRHPDGSYWTDANTQMGQTKSAIKKAISWGCPYVLYWQMYCNEQGGGQQRGYWLIDNTNTKQPVYYEHETYLAKANTLKNLHRYWLARNPNDSETQSFGGSYDSYDVSSEMDNVLNNKTTSSNLDFATFLVETLLGDPNHSSKWTYKSQLDGGTPRSTVVNNALNSSSFASAVSNADFVDYLYTKSLQRGYIDHGSGEFQSALNWLAGSTRAAVWRSFLDSGEFRNYELLMRDVNEVNAPRVWEKYWFRLNYGGPLAPPTGLDGTPASTAAGLDWNDNTESNLAGYNVYRSSSESTGFSKLNGSLITSSNYTDYGLTNGGVYFYRVTAVNTASQETAASNTVVVMPNNTDIIRIEAEGYDVGASGTAYYDTTSGNTGGAVRSGNVDIGGTSEGPTAGWIDTGEWLKFSDVYGNGGEYSVLVRHASALSGGNLRLEVNGVNATGTIVTPGTGGWDTWQTKYGGIITLPNSANTLRVVMESPSWNLNYLSLERVTVVEAENYTSYYDTTAGNTGGAYRSDDVDITTCSTGGYCVGWVDPWENLVFNNVNVPKSGTYEILVNVASISGSRAFNIEFNGVDQTGVVWWNNTGGWQTWNTISAGTGTLNAGTNTVKIVFHNGAQNINWIKLVPR